MEAIHPAQVEYRLIRLPQYEKDLSRLKRLKPKLPEAIRDSLQKEIEPGKLDEIPGSGGWVKGRAASPSRNIGKSGGFRFIYFLFRVEQDIYLFAAYDHRQKLDLDPNEIKQLKSLSEALKKSYKQGRKP